MRVLTLLLVLLCVACSAAPKREVPICPTKPVTVEVPVPVWSGVPRELVQRVPDPFPRPLITVGDAEDAAKSREIALEQCNARLEAIGELR